MKRMILTAVVILVVFLAGCVIYVPRDDYYGPDRETSYSDREDYRDSRGRDISYFYDYLSDYGVWVWNAPHGYVWIPSDVPYRWRPYSHGRWVWTHYGWTWISAFEWGWVPFHYGRWGWERDLGWFWVPDTVWGPAWVVWRSGDLYFGWAPLPPGAAWRDGRLFFDDIPDYSWLFCDGRYFLDNDLRRWVLPYERNITIVRQTMLKANIELREERIVNRGIEVDEIRRATRAEVELYDLRDASRPGLSRLGAREVELYRPEVRKSETAKPRRVVDKGEAANSLRSRPLRGDRRPALLSEEDELKEDQRDERRLLERSQEEELNLVKRKAEEDLRKAAGDQEKKKVEADAKEKVVELKKRHDAEKEELETRHKVEADKVQKRKIKKD
jgi:hypothetical protein